jgi:CDP-glucose 4,6-dehydratase
MPDIISSLQNEEDIMLRNPNHVRPWQHVLEPTFGYLHLAQKLSQGGSLYATGWNFGPDEGDEKSVEWITEEMIKKWNSKVRVSKSSEYSPYEAHYLKLNCSKAEEELKWRPKLNISEALDYIVEWYKQKDLDLAVKDIVRSQILNYINK